MRKPSEIEKKLVVRLNTEAEKELMKHRRRENQVPVDVNRDRIGKDMPAGWVEVAPGLSFGVRAYPSRWHRFWLWVLCGWTFRTTREPVQ